MGLLGDLIGEVTHRRPSHSPEPAGDYGPPPRHDDPNDGLPPGWLARYDGSSGRWFYVEESTGRTQWDRPGYYGGGGGGYYGGGYSEPPKKDHKLAYGLAGGAAVGLVGGMLVDHEVHKEERKWDDEKYRLEGDYDNAKYAVEDAPDRVAGWAGQEVGDVEGDYDRVKYGIEDAPEEVADWAGRKVGDVEGDFDRAEDRIEDAPEDVAEWAGRKVGDVEGDFDRVEDGFEDLDDAYDAGRDEARYEKDYDDY